MNWIPVETLPDFNGRVEVKISEIDEINIGFVKTTVLSCWYETGNRRWPRGFSLLNPRLIPLIVEWRKKI
jgi:hypothetical protein